MADLKKLVLLCAVALFVLMGASFAQDAQVSQSVQNDISPAVADLPAVSGAPTDAVNGEGMEGPENASGPLVGSPGLSQGTQTINLPANQATITHNFPGLSVNAAGAGFFAPPDTVGAVGNGQYVQSVNVSFAVFDKNTGATLAGPFLVRALWSGFGGECETHNNGDPIVQFDKIANRWIISQFSINDPATGTPSFLECVAVSTTPDATGTFARYAFPMTNPTTGVPEFPDYPKLATWPDAYHASYNVFKARVNGGTFVGTKMCAMERAKMLVGLPATQICFQRVANAAGTPEQRSYNNLLPADFDGTVLPPPGSDEIYISQGFYASANFLQMYKFHADFAVPANSTFTGNFVIVPSFAAVCLAQSRQACIPQPPSPTAIPANTSDLLESLTARLMHRAVWRMAGGREELLATATVDVGGGRAGIRWYESQNPRAANPTFFQAANFGPNDGNWRWMPSIAMDKMGNIAVAYSVSNSTTTKPSIAFSGRLRSELRNVLEPETVLWNGTGVQARTNGAQALLARWGDYSALTVDPADDCTFYYTTEYIPVDGQFNWATRIASFKFPNCN